ncbi:MAG: hypothetical protein IT467_04425 [Dokdonella sp.]|uniref:hypothetical protein n=1 Tax=Dokdonella sp. TaxID=2291710 RepID=UPI0025B83E91|nr:hypothetical protein [Dokdonella sp.]MBZ0223171.1 hypothetical protein [Dokdonella sp.]MCC7255163.1 hypothetical protein [Dokdonella sp.]
MTASAWHQFIFIGGLGLVASGLTTYLMVSALVGVTLRDRHPDQRKRLGGIPFTPRQLLWFLAARWRALRDPSVSGLAVLGTIGTWSMVVGAIAATIAKWLSLTGAGA